MKPSNDNTFCWFPFTTLALKQWDTKVGIIMAAPCCNSIRPDNPDPLGISQELRDNPHTVTAHEILNGKRHSACATCWKMEDSTKDNPYSYRLDSTPSGLYRPTDEESLNELAQHPQLTSIDFAFGENCNLRCRMCTPGLSNKLRLDYRYFKENNIDTSDILGFDHKRTEKSIVKDIVSNGFNIDIHDANVLDDYINRKDVDLVLGAEHQVFWWNDGPQWKNILDNIHTLNHIKATGGETLISKPFIEFLDTAIAKGVSNNILLEFHTNATKFSNENIKKLKQFDGLNLNLSIDSVGKNYEYIRYPMKFDKLENSLRNILSSVADHKYKRTPSGFIKTFSFNVVLSALNAHYLEDLVDFQYGLNSEYTTSVEHANFYVDLLWPEEKFINVKFLPRHIKEDIIVILNRIVSKYPSGQSLNVQVDGAINFITANLDLEITEQHRLNMLREIKVFDSSRNQCYTDFIHHDIITFLETPII